LCARERGIAGVFGYAAEPALLPSGENPPRCGRLPHRGRISPLFQPHCACVFAPITEPGASAMRRYPVGPTLILAVLAAATLSPVPVLAQGQQTPQILPLKPPPPPPIKPYTPVAAKPPVAYDDAAFVAFRKQLSDAATKKDRATLAKLVVAQGFFWFQDKDVADPKKPGVDNLAKAINLAAKDGSGWATLGGYGNEPTAAELPDRKGVLCAPADPTIDPQAFEALGKATQTDPSEWGYPLNAGVEVHAAAQPNSPVVEKLGLNLVHVLPDSGAPNDPNPPAFLHVATPSGKSGFVAMDAIAALGGDQMCYTKDAGGWKITGYFGGANQ
jgi:hypothetical protein